MTQNTSNPLSGPPDASHELLDASETAFLQQMLLACPEGLPKAPDTPEPPKPLSEPATTPQPEVLPSLTLNAHVSVIITCGPGYDKWVLEAYESAARQASDVVVVFDCCVSENPQVDKIPCTKIWGAWQNVQKARKAGLVKAKGQAVVFLDADDLLGEHYISGLWDAITTKSETTPALAGVYPDIRYSNIDTDKFEGQLLAAQWDKDKLERKNYICCSAMVWKHALETSWRDITTHDRYEDHHMWSQLVRDGWVFAPCLTGEKLHVRTRGDSMSRKDHSQEYKVRYDLMNKPLTVFVPMTSNKKRSAGLRSWLNSAGLREWGMPWRLHIRTEDPDPPMLDFLLDTRVERAAAVLPRLAELPREEYGEKVNLQMCHIYNKFAQDCTTEFALILEEDVVPNMPLEDLLNEMYSGFSEDVAAVSGVYRDRRNGNLLAWSKSSGNHLTHIKSMENERFTQVEGTGFGCLLVRTQVLKAIPHAAPNGEWFDPRFFRLVNKLGWKVLLANKVKCAHMDMEKGEVLV